MTLRMAAQRRNYQNEMNVLIVDSDNHLKPLMSPSDDSISMRYGREESRYSHTPEDHSNGGSGEWNLGSADVTESAEGWSPMSDQWPVSGVSSSSNKNMISCSVCGDVAAGFHCGAYVCEACKKFFVRCLKHELGSKFVCASGGQCEITKITRTLCPRCRYQKCVDLGMYRPGGPNISQDIGHIPCKVCGAPSSGFHFGAITCEGCKGFFRRTVKERDGLKYRCKGTGTCVITWNTRNVCKMCRYQRCLSIGMFPDKSRIGRQPNSVKHATMIELQQIKVAKGLTDDPTGPRSGGSLMVPFPKLEPLPNDDDNYGGIGDYNCIDRDIPRLSQYNVSNSRTTGCDATYHSSSRSSHASGVPGAHAFNSRDELLGSRDNEHHIGSFDYTQFMPYRSSTTKDARDMAQYSEFMTSPGSAHSSDIVRSNSISRRSTFMDINDDFSSPGRTLAARDETAVPMVEVSQEATQPIREQGLSEAEKRTELDEGQAMITTSSIDTLPDFDIVITVMEQSFNHLAAILVRPISVSTITAEMSIAELWDNQMSMFAQHAGAMLKFAKKVPGFRSFSLDEQIRIVQSCMFPIVVVVLSLVYDQETKSFRWFGYTQDETVILLHSFHPFQLLLPIVHRMGNIIRELDLEEIETAFLCALFLLDSGNQTRHKALLLDALAELCKRKDALNGEMRCGQILMCLRHMSEADQVHNRAVKILLSDQKFASLEIPQLFKESFLGMDC